jgi:hypothetical protein
MQQKFKVITHFLAWGLGSLIAFSLTPTGIAAMHQFPKVAAIVGVLVTIATVFGIYSQPKAAANLLILALIPLIVFGLVACQEQPKVLAALGVVQNVIAVAQADLPGLQVSGVITQAGETAAESWLTGASSIVGEGITCVTGLGSSGSGTAIASCVTTIGTGLISPTQEAQLRIVDAKSQHNVQIYVTAVILGVNLAAEIVNAIQQTTPVVGTAPATAPVTTKELRTIVIRAGATPGELAYAGL